MEKKAAEAAAPAKKEDLAQLEKTIGQIGAIIEERKAEEMKMAPPMMGFPPGHMAGMGMPMEMGVPPSYGYMEAPVSGGEQEMGGWEDFQEESDVQVERTEDGGYGVPRSRAEKRKANKKNKMKGTGDAEQKEEEEKRKQELKVPKYKNKEEKKKEEEHVDVSKIDQSKEFYAKVDENLEPMNIVFIGHVDAGKSTICGNILLKAGMVDPEEMRRYEQEAKQYNRESWVLAYIMDLNEEEREKGKTVEVGKTLIKLKKKRYTLMDAPGHKNYVPNMISGASQADVACLVISAKQGEFESGFEKGGQTREHAMLAKTLGVSYMICAINKMDEVGWSKSRFDEIQRTISTFLLDNCGYAKECLSWVPLSGLKGDNLDKPSPAISWYSGDTLLESLDNVPSAKRNNKILRIPILDKTYSLDKSEELSGVCVYGKIETGTIREGMQVVVMPKQKDIVIEKIFNVLDERVAYAVPGENVKLKIKGNEDMDFLKRGNVICGVQYLCFVCFEFEAEVQMLQLLDTRPIVSDGYKCIMHLHIAMEEITITSVKKAWDEKTKQFVPAKHLRSTSRGIVNIKVPSSSF